MSRTKISFWGILICIGFTVTSATYLGDYSQVIKTELQVIPEWTNQVPSFRHIFEELLQKYEEVMEMEETKKKPLTREQQRYVSSQILAPSGGMTQLTIHLLERLISSGILRTDVWNFVRNNEDLSQMKSHIEEIVSTLRSFQEFPPDPMSESNTNPTAPVLQVVLDVFTRKDSVFQKYPLHSVSLLLPVSHQVLASAVLERDRFARKKLLCGLRSVWDKYETLAVTERLNEIQVFEWNPHKIVPHSSQTGNKVPLRNCTVDSCPENLIHLNTTADIFLVQEQNYHSQGYGKMRRASLLDVYYALDGCSFRESEHFGNWLSQHKSNAEGFVCIVDPLVVGNKKFVTYRRESDYFLSPSLRDYFSVLRGNVELSFRNMLNSIDAAKLHLSECHLTPSGSVEVTIVRAELTSEKGPYDKDKGGEVEVLPDPYVRIIADGVEVGRTSVINNTHIPEWVDTFRVDKVYSWSDVRVQLYDRDGEEGDKDDDLGGVDLELVNIVEGGKKTFVWTRQDIAFGKITVGVKYIPKRSHEK